MAPMLLRRFQSEIELQCEFVLLAASVLQRELDADWPDTTRLWFGIQGILIAASNIAKLLYGSRGKRATDRQTLQESIGIDTTSCLYDPKLRNEFEHIDERLDRWYREDPNHIFVGRMIGPPTAIHIAGEPAQRRFGTFDPETGKATFWDREESLVDIVREVQRILPAVRREAAKPHWES